MRGRYERVYEMQKRGILRHHRSQGLLHIKRDPPSETEHSPTPGKHTSAQVSYSQPEASLGPSNSLQRVAKHHQAKLKLSNFFRMKANESGVIYKPDSLYCRMQRLSRGHESKAEKQTQDRNFEKTHEAIVNNLSRVFERKERFERVGMPRARSAHLCGSRLVLDPSDSELQPFENNSLLMARTDLVRSTKGIVVVKPKVDLVKSFIMDLKTAAQLREPGSSSKRNRHSDSP